MGVARLLPRSKSKPRSPEWQNRPARRSHRLPPREAQPIPRRVSLGTCVVPPRRHPLSPDYSHASSPPPSISQTPAHTSHGPGPVFYPITTAVPAANPHRYTPAWSPPLNTQHNFSFPPPRERHDTLQPRVNGMGIKIVDPATIPLPANSPPASAVSFSSRSSVSRSSLSHTADSVDSASSTGCTNGTDHGRSSLNTLVRFHGTSTDDGSNSGDSSVDYDQDEEEVNEEEESQSSGEVQSKDLEITNRSLLAINSTLESAKHRQAKEIRELKRKLRESRLILPPRTYKAVKSSLDHDDTAEDGRGSDPDEEADDEGEQEGDESYRRVKMLLDGLLDSGRKALERKPEDFVGKVGGGAKVLHADDLREDGDGDAFAVDRENYLDVDDDTGSFMLGSQATIQPSRGSLGPNDGPEGMTISIVPSRSPSPGPPPVVVTHT